MATKPSSKRPRMSAYPPISREGYEAVCTYLDQALAHEADPSRRIADTALLRVGLPQGSILNITSQLGIQVRDTSHEGLLRNPRLVDPETVVLIRLLLLSGGSMGLNRKNMHQPNRKDYPHLRWCVEGVDWKIPLLRLVADTQRGFQTPSAENHYSLRRADIPDHQTHRPSYEFTREGLPTKSPHFDRSDAIALAVRLLMQNAHRLDFAVTPDELHRRISQTLKLLDRRPLKAV